MRSSAEETWQSTYKAWRGATDKHEAAICAVLNGAVCDRAALIASARALEPLLQEFMEKSTARWKA
jgi:hypothetical protein